MTQHQKHFQKMAEILLTLLMNIILCDERERSLRPLMRPKKAFKNITLFFT